MKKMTRREAVGSVLAAGAGLIVTGAATAQTASPKVFSGAHQPKPLPFDPAKLIGISEKLIRSHWENNYSGSVRALNVVEQRLAAMMKEKDAPAFLYGDLKREELIRTGSVVLHEKYFANLGGSGKANGPVVKLIEQSFGDVELWESEFKRTAAALGGGSGWTILAYDLHDKLVRNHWAADHAQGAPLSIPLLVLDMYEHSYQMDYGAAAAKYIDAFMQNINWEEVNRRAEAAARINFN